MEDTAKKRARIAASWLGYLTVVTFVCQWLVFKPLWQDVGLSVLIGTCGTLAGAFAALLASPYGAKDEERLSKVAATVGTLVTGYLVGRIIDPLIASAMENPEALLNIKVGANILVGLIGFLGGFLGTYVFRAYVSSPPENNEPESADTKEQSAGNAAAVNNPSNAPLPITRQP